MTYSSLCDITQVLKILVFPPSSSDFLFGTYQVINWQSELICLIKRYDWRRITTNRLHTVRTYVRQGTVVYRGTRYFL